MLAVYAVFLAPQYIHSIPKHLLSEERRLVLFVQDVLLHHRFLHPFGSLLLSDVCLQDGIHFWFQPNKLCNRCSLTLILHLS